MFRPLLRIFVVAWVMLLMGAAKPGFVRTTDGRVFQGAVTDERPQNVLVKTAAGLTITLPASQIAKIDFTADIREAYKLRVADLPADADYKAHVDIAQWMMDNKVYDLAREQTLIARTMAPNEPGPMLLLQTITQLIAWEAAKTPTSKPAVVEKRFLDPDQINMIRLMELTPRDSNVPIRIDNDLQKRFVDYARLEPRGFAALSNFDKAMRILSVGQPEMRKEIKVNGDPSALLEYKNNIQPLIMSTCATASCHGNAKSATFRLIPSIDNEAASYTNFYLLTQSSITLSDKKYAMIDRVRPESSLLALYGMNPDISKIPHPKVIGWKAIFTNPDDPRYRTLLRWMGSRLVAVAPNYEIKFELPTDKPETPDNAP